MLLIIAANIAISLGYSIKDICCLTFCYKWKVLYSQLILSFQGKPLLTIVLKSVNFLLWEFLLLFYYYKEFFQSDSGACSPVCYFRELIDCVLQFKSGSSSATQLSCINAVLHIVNIGSCFEKHVWEMLKSFPLFTC